MWPCAVWVEARAAHKRGEEYSTILEYCLKCEEVASLGWSVDGKTDIVKPCMTILFDEDMPEILGHIFGTMAEGPASPGPENQVPMPLLSG